MNGKELSISDYKIWNQHAQWWKDTFTQGRDEEYDALIIPLILQLVDKKGLVLDIGSGEGQIARSIAALSGELFVVGIDPSEAQLQNALLIKDDAKDRIFYVEGVAECLPFPDNSYEMAVCCLVIEHTVDQDMVLREVARVLKPGGKFILLINHPFFQGTGSGLIDDQILGEKYWRVGPYLVEDVAVEEVDPGVMLPFAHRPISRYINPLAEMDFVLVQMVEPSPLENLIDQSVAPELESAIPRLLAMVFEYRYPLQAV